MKKYIYTFLIIMGFTTLNAQQYDSYFSGSYKLSIPLAEFSESLNSVSYRGGEFNLQFINEQNLAFGFNVTWTGFYDESDRTTQQIETSNYGAAVTAKHFDFAYFTDLQVNTRYYVVSPKYFKPFIGARIGTTYTEGAKIVGVYSATWTDWVFGYNAEIGTLIQIPNRSWGFEFSANYNQSLTKSDFYNNAQYVGFNMGIFFSPHFDF